MTQRNHIFIFSMIVALPLGLAGLQACSDDDSHAAIDAATSQDADLDATLQDATSTQDADVAQDAEADGQTSCDPGDHTSTPHARAVITTSSYGNGGGMSVITLADQSVQADVAQLAEDSITRWFDHKLWVLGRYNADNLTILDGDDYHLLGQYSLGVGTNPQDIVCVSTCKCYVTSFDTKDLLVIDPTADASDMVTSRIDLSPVADPDGLPEATYMLLDGTKLLIVSQRLDHNDPNMAPTGNGALIVVDTQTDTIQDMDPQTQGIQPLELPCVNPFSPIVLLPNSHKVAIACAGDFQDSADQVGIGVVDLDNWNVFEGPSFSDLFGRPMDLTMESDDCGFVVVTDPSTWDSALVHFCMDQTDIWDCIPMGMYDSITDAAITDNGQLLVTDGSYTNPGIRILDPNDHCTELTQDVLSTGFAPSFADPILLVPATSGN